MYAAFMQKYFFAILLAILLMAGFMGFSLGRHHCSEERRMAQDAYRTLELRFNAASAELQHLLLDQQHEAHTIQKQLDTVVQEPIYRRECIDDAGLRLANRALSTAPP